MSGWSDPQKGGRAVGAALFPSLSSLLSTAPQPGMRATASDAPGSMLYEVGGKWGGDPGVFPSTTDANYIAYMAAIAAQMVVPSAVILIGTATATAVAMTWQGEAIGYLRDVYAALATRDWAFVGDSITAAGCGFTSGLGTEIKGGRYSPGYGIATALSIANSGGMRFARNFGFGGKGCAYLLSVLSTITNGPWKNYCIQIGTNDIDGDTAQPLLDYAAFLQGLRSSGALKIVCIAIPPKYSALVGPWNAAQSAICDRLGIPFLNPYRALETTTTGFPIVAKYKENPNAVHPCPSTMLLDVATELARIPDRPTSKQLTKNVGMPNLMVNGFFATGSSLGTGWGESNSVDSIVSYSGNLPVHGRVQRITPAVGSTSMTLKQNAMVTEVGKEYSLTIYVKLTKLRRNAWSLNIADGPIAGGTVISAIEIPAISGDTTSETIEGFFSLRFVALSTTTSLLLAHSYTAGDAIQADYADAVLEACDGY